MQAVERAHAHPERRSEFWLSGARHPAAFHRTGEGRAADALRKKPNLHYTLVLEGLGLSRPAAARRLGVKSAQVGERLSEIRTLLHVRNLEVVQ